MFEKEYLWNAWARKVEVDAKLIKYNCPNFKRPIDLAFSPPSSI